jgi:hypothetical protein
VKLLAACDGREGNPGDYRDYRFKLLAKGASPSKQESRPERIASVKG